MASQQNFPLIPSPHAPTRHHPYTEPFTNGSSSSDRNPTRSGSETSTPNNNKKPKKTTTESEYRKDREEWSETAIACLLEAYTEKYKQLNRTNLRGRDWEEVAESVTEKCGGGSYKVGERKSWKSVEQCKNKIDNLKKRYKVELQKRIVNNNNNNNIISNWHWFKKIEGIIGNIEEKSSTTNGGGGSILNNLRHKLQVNLKWRRVVFKISGTALAGNCQSIDSKVVVEYFIN